MQLFSVYSALTQGKIHISYMYMYVIRLKVCGRLTITPIRASCLTARFIPLCCYNKLLFWEGFPLVGV